MKIYCISGLGADQRVFQYLKVSHELVPLDWIEPVPNEDIAAYTRRLLKSIDTSERYTILGVSFGGLVAVEASRVLAPFLTILISSAETYHELRMVYRAIGRLNLVRWIPSRMFDPPRKIAYWLFGANNKKLLNEILDNTDLSFAKWAIGALTAWKNDIRITPVLKISGSQDKLIPPTNDERTIVIAGGEHFMIVDRAFEISQIINEKIESLLAC